MNLERLQLQNFRTYESLDISFERRLTFITGPNAFGKTNILEAISLLSVGKSFRGAADEDMVRSGTNHYHIAGVYKRTSTVYQVEFACELSDQGIKRRIRLNGKQLPSRSSLIGQLVTVVFSPSDIMIVEGGPALRRRFLDLVLSSHDTEYLNELILYNRALRQRNSLLKKVRERKIRMEELDPWDSTLARHASRVTSARRAFIAEFQGIFQDALSRISKARDIVELSLETSEGEDDLSALLKKTLYRDTAVGHTGAGPHRHQLLMSSSGRDIQSRGSQGQKRSLVLALRIAQFEYLKKRLGLAPVLLIDDVLRELDKDRTLAFVQLLRDCGQAIFTTPDAEAAGIQREEFAGEISVYKVREPGHIQLED